jgi:hypothetical protein
MIFKHSDAGVIVTVPNSIFQQLCPACATSIPINATRCECGHDLSGAGTPLETTLRDEELYENYLNARAEQARESEQIAARALMEDRDNPDLIAALTLAREVAQSIDEDLAGQRTKIQKLRSLLPPPVVSLPPVEPPHVEATPVLVAKPEPNVVKPADAVQPTASTQPKTPEIAPPAESPAVILTKTPVTDRTPTEPGTPSPVVTPAHTVMTKAATALSALKQAKAREGQQQLAALRAQIARQKKAEQEKLEKVEREAEANRRTQLSSTPPPSFREEQAARAERALQDHIQLSGKECPNCTSRVPLATTRCQCGFAFASGDTELPSLTLCTGDFTALRNTFLADLRSRR